MKRLAVALAAAGVLAACGSDSEDHGGGESEHSSTHAGMTTPEVAGHGEEIGGSHGEAARGPGATDRHELDLALDAPDLRAGEAGELAFEIRDAGGDPVTRFEVEHTKQVHLIVVSRDLEHFQHVHPQADRQGTWRARVRPQAPGEYRVIADVVHEGRRLAVDADMEVAGDPVATGAPAPQAEFVEQDLMAGHATTLEFRAPDRTGDYLGAAGHLVILREGDLEYLHVHPQEDELAFEASFPRPGRYVMFLEYKSGAEVRLSRFPVTVA